MNAENSFFIDKWSFFYYNVVRNDVLEKGDLYEKAFQKTVGYVDDVKIRWSKAGMTNISLLTTTLNEAVNGGLVSRRKAFAMWNFDDDEQQIQEGYEEMLREKDEEEQWFQEHL